MLHHVPAGLDLCCAHDECAPLGYCQLEACAAPGRCQWRPELCLMVYDPVCGCDGKTYGNACLAANQRMSVAHPGECPGD